MNLNSDLSKEAFSNFYNDHKEYFAPVGSLIVSFFILFYIIFPQISSIPDRKSAYDSEVQKNENLKKYQLVVRSFNPATVDSQLKSASQALPPAKDFQAILNAIISAANNTNTAVESYQLESAAVPITYKNSKYPALVFTIEVIGGPYEATSFMKDLYKTSPVSEVLEINTKEQSTKLLVAFYYKPFNPVNFEQRTGIKTLSQPEKKTLDDIFDWNNPVDENLELPLDISTSSAEESL